MEKLSQEEVIKSFKKTHGDKYDYSLVEYKNSKVKVKIICSKHGEFFQTPHNHLMGCGCPKCSNKKEQKKLTTESFIVKAKTINNNYDYSKVDYVNINTKVKIICPKHGVFEITPHNFLAGHGCQICGFEISHQKRYTTKSFIEKAKRTHPDLDYSKTIYNGFFKNIIITCPKHGDFEQTPCNHLRRLDSCPKCSSSKGENKIRNYLKENGILFEEQKKFKETKKLRYDFYLLKEDLLIEYNGRQHYEPVKAFGGEEQLIKQQENDKIKKEYAEKYHNFLEISYKDFNNIEEILRTVIYKN